MTTDDQIDAETLAGEFADLKQRLQGFIEAADPSAEDLHFARFRRLGPESWHELSRLAAEGRERVDARRHLFLRHGLYADGMFWYDLLLTISRAAQSHERAAGKLPGASDARELIPHLVRISEYTAAVPSDIRKRNQEALGDVLLNASDQPLRGHATAEAKEMNNSDVVAFVEETITKVDQVASGPRRT